MLPHQSDCFIQTRHRVVWHIKLLTRPLDYVLDVRVVRVADRGKQVVLNLMVQSAGEVVREGGSWGPVDAAPSNR